MSLVPWLVGAGGLLALLAFIPGVKSYVSESVGAIFNGIVSVFSFTLNKMPKPFQILILFVILSAVGGFFGNYLIGADKMCIKDDVYKVPLMSAISFKSFNLFEGKGVELASVTTNNFVNNDSNLIKVSKVTENNKNYYLLNGLVAVNGIKDFSGSFEEFSLLPETQVFETILGFETNYLTEDICYSSEYDSCVIVMADTTLGVSEENACKNYQFGGLIGSLFTDSNSFNTRLGRITYELDSSGTGFEVKFSDTYLGSKYTLSSCLYSDDLTSKFKQSEKLTVVQDQLLGVDYQSGIIYNSGYYPLKVVKENDFTEDYDAYYFDNQQDSLTNALSDLLDGCSYDGNNLNCVESADIQLFSDEGLLGFTCNDESDNPYDVNVSFMGIDIFSRTTLVFVFLISVVLGIYGYFNRWT